MHFLSKLMNITIMRAIGSILVFQMFSFSYSGKKLSKKSKTEVEKIFISPD